MTPCLCVNALQGAAMAARTAAWLASHPFASEEELAAVGHLLRWDGVDAAGRPVLHIAIGRAVVECRGPAALGFANAIITQLQRAVEGMLGEWRAAGPPMDMGN